MQLHPHRVVRVAQRGSEPLPLPAIDFDQGVIEAILVAGESRHGGAEVGEELAHARVDRMQTVDDLEVVLGVTVVVRDTAPGDLPVVTRAAGGG